MGDVPLFLSLLGHLWTQLPLRPCEVADNDASAIRIEVVGDHARKAASEQNVAEKWFYGEVAFARRGERLYVTHPSAHFEIEGRGGLGTLSLRTGGESSGRRALHDVFLIGFSRLLAEHAMFDLHAACLCRGNLACLLIGPSGSGKSTATISLIRSGWTYLSDDAVLLRNGYEGVEALSFRRTPFIEPHTLKCFPELAERLPDSNPGRKVFLDVERSYGARQLECCRPTALVLCELTGKSTTSLEPVHGVEAMLGLIEQSASLGFTREHPRAQMATLKTLIEQSVVFRLRAGTDLLVHSERLSQLMLEGLAREGEVFKGLSPSARTTERLSA